MTGCTLGTVSRVFCLFVCLSVGQLWSWGLLPNNQRPQLNSCTFLIQFLNSSPLPSRKSEGERGATGRWRVGQETNEPGKESRKEEIGIMILPQHT